MGKYGSSQEGENYRFARASKVNRLDGIVRGFQGEKTIDAHAIQKSG